MRKVKVNKAEQFVFFAVAKQEAVIDDKVREMLLATPLLPKWEAWRVEVLARPVSGKEVSA